jgi:hypothetical protein
MTFFYLGNMESSCSLTLLKGATAVGIKSVVENSAADYELEPTKQNPVEIAARLAALDVLKRIQEQPRNESRPGRHR